MSRLPPSLGGGLVAGLIGAAVWAAISYFTEYEIGYLAWGIGLLVGYFVRLGSQEWDGIGPGILAAVLALASIVAGKYATVEIVFAQNFNFKAKFTTDDAKVQFSNVIIEERQKAGVNVQMPENAANEEAPPQTRFPEDVWKEASTKWDAMSAEEQQALTKSQIEAQNAMMRTVIGQFKWKAFTDSFGPIDLVFGFLAIITAYRVAAGSDE